MLQIIIEKKLTQEQQTRLLDLLTPIIFSLTEEQGNKITVNELFDTLCQI